MTGAIKRRGEPFDKLWQRFEKVCKKAGIKNDAARHEVHMSQGERDRAKHRDAQRQSMRG